MRFISFRPLIVVLLLATNFDMHSQSLEVDSLQHAVEISTGSKKVDALNALAFRQLINDLAKAEQSIKESIRLAEQHNYQPGLAEAYVYRGIYENMRGDKEGSLTDIRKGMQLSHQLKLSGLEGYALVQSGNVFRGYGQYDSALYWYEQAHNVLKDSLNPWQLSVLYRNLGMLSKLKTEPQKEITYLLRSYNIRKNLPDKVLLSDILVQLSGWYIDQSDIELAKVYLDQAEQVGLRDTLFEIQQGINYQKAIVAYAEARYLDALKLLRDVRRYYFRVGNSKQYVKLLLDVATVLEESANYDLSLKNAIEALSISEEKKFIDDQTTACLIITWNYYRINQFTLATQYADKALQLSTQNKFKSEMANALMLKGVILNGEKNYGAALVNLEQSLGVWKDIDAGKGTATTLSIIGETYEALGDLSKAVDLYQQSLTIREHILYQNGMAWSYLNLGSAYTKLNDFEKASRFLDKAEEKARSIKSGTVLVKVYQLKRQLLQQRGKTEQALTYSILYEELKDSVNSVAVNNRILGLQSVYELDKQTKEIELLNQQKEVQQAELIIQTGKIRQQRIIIASIFLGLIFLAALTYVSYKYFKKTKKLNNQLQEKNEEIMAQAEELAESNLGLTELNKALLEKQDEIEAQSEELRESNEVIVELNQSLEDKVNERTTQLQQAYKELDTFFYRSSHDFRRPLTTFMGLAEVAKITLKEKEAIDLFSKVEVTAINLDRMLIKLQSISDVEADQMVVKLISIRSVFENALHTYRQEITEFGVRTEIHVPNDQPIKVSPAQLKKIVENLVENAIHFRTPEKPTIKLEAIIHQTHLVITVSDNGPGIDEIFYPKIFDMFFRGSERSKGNGLGLYIVKKAVEKMNGRVFAVNLPPTGCAFTVEVPST